MKAMIVGCVAAVLVVLAAAAGPVSGTTYLSLYADAGHSITKVDGTPFYSADVWVWCYPDAKGMLGAEFRLAYPSNAVPSAATMNSAISVALGSLTDGISVTFGTCQNEWSWIAHQAFWVMNAEYGEIVLEPRPEVGLQIASCELGYPIYPAGSLNNRLSMNCQAAIEAHKPLLTDVEIVAADSILATFDQPLWYGAEWFLETHHFRVMNITDPPETLAISAVGYGAWQPGIGYPTAWIKLGENLAPGIEYMLEAVYICSNGSVGSCCCCGYCLACTDSEIGFAYAPIATLLRDYSIEPRAGAVRVSWQLGMTDEGISFLPLRLERGAGDYTPLTVAVIEDRTLHFGFDDDGLAPGHAYRYRIDYLVDGERATLFETDWIETPAARFALRQNLPNPFNPSTRITFELGAAGRATLIVYDVSGKLVRTLVDETLGAGGHSAFWDGRTERGEEASSGIYFYRLKAGSFTETKKMVLLR